MSRIEALVALVAMVVTIAVVAPLITTTGLPWSVVAAVTTFASIVVAGSAVGYLVRSVTDPEVTDA